MLYWLLYPLTDFWAGFNVFRYITFRATFAAVTAFLISLIFGPRIICRLKELNFIEKIRRGETYKQLENQHSHKEGIPTMGGLLILLSVLVPSLLWARLDLHQIWVAMAAMLWMGVIGFIDDQFKLRGIGGRRGLPESVKLIGQTLLGLGIALFLYSWAESAPWASQLIVPFYKHPLVWDMGLLGVLLIILVVVGSSNAVNLTDGLDGLAIGCVGIAAFACAVLAYVSGHREIAAYLNILFVPGAGELTVFCAALVGASLGFLWFNSYPAQVFMGDTGSLACGAALGTVAILIKKELFLILIGGIFVIEAFSVLSQRYYFKLTRRLSGEGRRIFLCAPLHHHFQYRKLAENKITVRFWICALVFALLALGALKLQ